MADDQTATDTASPTTADPTTRIRTVKVKLNRSHWIGEERIDPPAEIDVSLEDALQLIEDGVASRTDPLRAK